MLLVCSTHWVSGSFQLPYIGCIAVSTKSVSGNGAEIDSQLSPCGKVTIAFIVWFTGPARRVEHKQAVCRESLGIEGVIVSFAMLELVDCVCAQSRFQDTRLPGTLE